MTITVTETRTIKVVVACDACGEHIRTLVDYEPVNAREILTRQYGWVFTAQDKAICPNCWYSYKKIRELLFPETPQEEYHWSTS